MNGENEKIDDKKSWDLSNWGLNKEDVQQAQNLTLQKQNELSTDMIKNDIAKIDSNEER